MSTRTICLPDERVDLLHTPDRVTSVYFGHTSTPGRSPGHRDIVTGAGSLKGRP
jgi:hypothetical protein